jgi:type IV fimbrial biogenesis protein FimT
MKHVERNCIKGFTLIELMIGIALAAIIVSMAAPSFNSAMKNNKIVAETNEIIADINFARSEAVKRSNRVVLCRSASPSHNSPTCGGTASNWSSGWLVFADTDADNTYNAANDILIRIGNPADKTVTIKTNNTADQELVYNPDGTINTGGNIAVFAICDDRGKDHGRQVQISATGRPRLVAPVANSCDIPAV